MFEYLKDLPLEQVQKEMVEEEGYENAATFYMFCKATPEAVKQWLCLDSLTALEAALWNLMSADERRQVEEELAKL